jgi:autotransporter-associated beta strand protein
VSWTGVGGDGTTWDVNGQTNWHNNATNVADKFFDNDSVTFGDTYGPGNTPVGNTGILLNSTVAPLNMTFNSNTANYSITGTGKITGAASLTKTGSSVLTLQTANDFTGAANISGGTVDIGTAVGALGTGALTVSNATIKTAGGSTLTNPNLAIPSGTATLHTSGTATIVMPSVLTGAGTLRIVSDAPTKVHDLASNTSGFTGNLVIGTPGGTDGAIVRTDGANSSLPNSLVTLNGTSSLREKNGNTTLTLGGLAGESGATLKGYEGGSGATNRPQTWRIGSLNSNTTFNGTVLNSFGDAGTTAPTSIHKIGTGTLTLTGVHSYTGRTAVEQGTLSISPAAPLQFNYLADASDVLLFNGGILNLNFAGETDAIDQLFVNGISQPIGTYGRVGSGAQFESNLITGDGQLIVSTFRLPGDFDNSGTVDATDLDVWKAARVANNANGDTNGDGVSNGSDFLIWQRYLGATAATIATAAVPEPGSALLAAGALLALVGGTRRRN